MSLPTLILAIAALIGRGTPSAHVVEAIAQGCTEEAVAHPVDPQACAALVTVYAARESEYRTGVFGDGGQSYGLLHEPAAIARHLDALGQVKYWLRVLRESSLASVDSSPARAAKRERLAARLLERVTVGVTERQP